MINSEEIAPGIWLFHIEQTQSNYGVIMRDGLYLIVGPEPLDLSAEDLESVLGFPAQQGFESGTKIFFSANLYHSVSAPSLDEAGLEESALPPSDWQLLSTSGPGRPSVFNADERVLFCGSMLSDVDVPSLQHGSQEYLDNLERVEQLDPKLIVPSRGSPAIGKREIRSRIERDREYVYALRRQVETSRGAGVLLDRVLEVARSIYENYPFVEQHIQNVRYVWAEYTSEQK